MNLLTRCLIIGSGGMLGTIARYLIGLLPVKPQCCFPVATLLINVTGAFFIGLIAALAAELGAADSQPVLFLRIGVCGGFTTFSAFSLETVELFKTGKPLAAALYISATVLLCLTAVLVAEQLEK